MVDINKYNVFKCLFDELYKLIDENKFKINEYHLDKFKKSIEKIEIDTNDTKTNLVLVGDFNSGKTTCCNSLIASLINENDNNPWKDYDDLLPSSESENTYFITVIESSDSGNFELDHYEDDKLIKNISSTGTTETTEGSETTKVNLGKIRDYLEALDKNSTVILKEKNDIELKRSEDPNFKGRCPMNVVKVRIPFFSEKFRILDIPGMTNSSLRDEFMNYLQKNCLVSIFLVVRSLVHVKVTDVDFLKTTNKIVEEYPNSLSLLILTKVDSIKEKKPKDLEKFQGNLKSFLSYFEEKSKLLNNFETYIISCKESLEDNDVYKIGVVNLKNYMKEIELKFAERQKMAKLILKLKFCLHEFNSIVSEKVNCFDNYEVSQVKNASVQACDIFEEKIKIWIDKEINQYKYFEEKYEKEIIELKLLFKEHAPILLANKYFPSRNTFIENQVNYLSKSF